MQPILVFDIKKLIKLGDGTILSITDMEELVKYYINWLISHTLVPGQVEQFFIIVDLQDVKLLEIPIKKLRPFINVLQKMFISRLYRLVSCTNNRFLVTVYNTLIKQWLNEFLVESIHVLSGDECMQYMLKYLDVNDLERKFGGQRANLKSYWPI